MTFVTLCDFGELHSAGPATRTLVRCWNCPRTTVLEPGEDGLAVLVDHVRRRHPEVEIPDVLTIEEG